MVGVCGIATAVTEVEGGADRLTRGLENQVVLETSDESVDGRVGKVSCVAVSYVVPVAPETYGAGAGGPFAGTGRKRVGALSAS